MTRFEMELRGLCGDYWQKAANKELDKIEAELEAGKFTFDDAGVAYNCIGRVVTSEVAEKLHYVTTRINMTATDAAREIETEKSLNAYRESMKNHAYSADEVFAMRAAFGTGAEIVDVITGKRIIL